MVKLEIFDSGVYSYEEYEDFSQARTRILELGNTVHDRLLLAQTPDLKIQMNSDEYFIIGKYQNVWFSARTVK